MDPIEAAKAKTKAEWSAKTYYEVLNVEKDASP